MKTIPKRRDLSSFTINWALTKKTIFVSLDADKDGLGSNFGYLLPIPGAFRHRGRVTFKRNMSKEKKGGEGE